MASPWLFSGKNLLKIFLSLLFLKMRPSEAIEENLFQWVHLAAHSRFSLIWRKESSWVKAWSMDSDMMALP